MAIKETTTATVFKKRALEAAGEQTDERAQVLERFRNLETREDFRLSIEALWKRSQENFIQIGRYLIQAKEKLARGEYDAMIASELPFNRTLAFMMRSVAVAIDAARISPSECPMDCTAAYQLVSLPPEMLDLARSMSLVRPTLRRAEIVKFRREHFMPAEGERRQNIPVSESARRRLKARLEAKIQEMEHELRGAKALLREVCGTLNVTSPHADATIIDVDSVTVG